VGGWVCVWAGVVRKRAPVVERKGAGAFTRGEGKTRRKRYQAAEAALRAFVFARAQEIY